MKNLIFALSLMMLSACGGRDDEPTPPTVATYTQADAVGTWKATYYQRNPEGPNWHEDRNGRTITYKTDGNFTSQNMSESINTQLAGKYTITSAGKVSTSNLNMTGRTVSMSLSSKTEAILNIDSPSDGIAVKYKMVKQ